MHLAKTIRFSFICLTFSTIFLSSCWSGGGEIPKYQPDVSDLKASVEIIRFEKELSEIDTTNISQALDLLKEKHGEFANLYLKQILSGGRPVDLGQNLKGFLAMEESQFILDTIQQIYADMSGLKEEIENALVYYQHYFDEKQAFDKVYTFFSFYNYGVFSLDDFAGIGLDFFLGEDHIGYMANEVLRHQYIRRTLTKEHIVPKLTYALCDQIVNERSSKKSNTMLDEMIFNGKKYYLATALQPNTPDSLIYGFSAYQIEFCKRGEVALWEHLGKEQLLYSSEFNKYRKYVTEGPFRPDMDLPGNSGSWLGAQIVTQYAARLRKELKVSNPNLSPRAIDQQIVQNILKENEPSKFLQRYKPRKY
jgi:hypothetical protein